MALLRSAAKLVFGAADRLLASPPGPRILIYHQVGVGLGRQMEVSAEDFIWQLDWLERHRDVVSLGTALRRWGEPGSDRLVVISFDDGYRDTYTAAFPLLKERGLPFSLYLTSEAIGEDDRLTWDQVGEMASTGLATLGGHTHGHIDLREASEDAVIDELETSNVMIERQTGERPRHFAYPWGYWSPSADGAVRRAYESAVLGGRPAWRAQPFDRHLIYRYPVQLSDGRRWFEARLRGGLLLEETLRRRIRGYDGP